MEEGYLIIETSLEHPGLVRIRKAEVPPGEPDPETQTDPQIRYVARFNDLSAAQMHIHTELRHGLVDAEAGLYRSDPVAAVAAAQSVELRHRQIYLDPRLAGNDSLETAIETRRWHHRLADRIWQAVGILAVAFLLIKVFFGF